MCDGTQMTQTGADLFLFVMLNVSEASPKSRSKQEILRLRSE